MPSLPEWQVSLISVVVGATISFGFVIIKEKYEEYREGEKINDVIINELSAVKGTIEDWLSKAKLDEREGGRGRMFISDDKTMRTYSEYSLDTTYYDNLQRSDTKILVKHLSIDTLRLVRRTYISIYFYSKNNVSIVANGIWIDGSESKATIKQIEETITALKK